MDHGSKKKRLTHLGLVAGLVAVASPVLVGCQVDVNGQSLPSPYYTSDDIQYYSPGPEFKLANEAAALQAQKEARESQRQAP